ncbi:hypothetical protein STVA_45750 [Allostella vacuolata]|nr:hypothetical protein STVA_45750 [Stella vacuolata]
MLPGFRPEYRAALALIAIAVRKLGDAGQVRTRVGILTSGGWRRLLLVTLRRTTLEEQARRIAARMAELGIDFLVVPPNAGSRRTPEKRALLQVIADNARAQGREPAFAAKFQPPD